MSLNKIIELNENNICKICENQLGKYTCPRCNTLYCTLDCYKSEKHSECSEHFYKEMVMAELNSPENNDESKAKMLEILRKFQNQDDINIDDLDSDDEEHLDLGERLKNIDLDNVNEVWGHLTSDEQQEFEALVKTGDVTALVPIWAPWWSLKVAKRLVQEVGQDNTIDYTKNCPQLIKDIKRFSQLSKTKPADCVKYNILNVIAAYTNTVRYFNNDQSDFSNEFVYLLTNLSKNLQSNANFESYSLAIESTLQQMLINEWIQTDPETKHRLYKDVENVLEGPEEENKSYYIKCVLSDIHSMLTKSKKGRGEKKQDDFSRKFLDKELPEDKIVGKDKLKMYARKIEYYLSYVDAFVLRFP